MEEENNRERIYKKIMLVVLTMFITFILTMFGTYIYLKNNSQILDINVGDISSTSNYLRKIRHDKKHFLKSARKIMKDSAFNIIHILSHNILYNINYYN